MPWGHVVAELLSELPKELSVPATLVEKAKVLDNFYMPTRYANGHPVILLVSFYEDPLPLCSAIFPVRPSKPVPL